MHVCSEVISWEGNGSDMTASAFYLVKKSKKKEEEEKRWHRNIGQLILLLHLTTLKLLATQKQNLLPTFTFNATHFVTCANPFF